MECKFLPTANPEPVNTGSVLLNMLIKTYKTSLDKLAKGITIAVTILFALIIVAQFAISKQADMVSISISGVLMLVYFVTFAFRPVDYVLTQDALIIRRPFKNVKIDRNKIISIELLDKERIQGSTRTFGVGGLFGYYGKFFKFNLGKMTWYATRMDKIVLVRTVENENIILTPDDPNQFASDFSK